MVYYDFIHSKKGYAVNAILLYENDQLFGFTFDYKKHKKVSSGIKEVKKPSVWEVYSRAGHCQIDNL